MRALQPSSADPLVPESEEDATDSFSAYVEYNKILRTWFVAFGVGGPALFLINEKVAERLAKIGELRFVAILFLVGAASQIVGAFLNKVANWYVYRSVEVGDEAKKLQYRIANWIIKQFWIDIGLDILTFACFGVAAWQLLTAFAAHG